MSPLDICFVREIKKEKIENKKMELFFSCKPDK